MHTCVCVCVRMCTCVYTYFVHCVFVLPQKPKSSTKDILAEAGKHSYADQVMFDKVSICLLVL